MSVQQNSSKAVQATLLLAVITLIIAVMGVGFETTMEEDEAKVFVMPLWYTLVGMSALTVASGGVAVFKK